MDTHYRTLLREWQTSPSDPELIRQLDQEITRKGGGLHVREALRYNALAQEILTHFGRSGNPTLYFSSLLASASGLQGRTNDRPICRSINQAIQVAEEYVHLLPGELPSDDVEGIPTQIVITGPIFLLMSDYGIGRFASLAGNIPFLSNPHAYRENIILYDKEAQTYAALHGVPLHQESLPRKIANNIPGARWRFDDGPDPIWCYRLFNPDVFEIAVDLAGCHGDGSRRNRGCRQHVFNCICKEHSLCVGCLHCFGCGYHNSQCVCEEFHYSEVGPGIAISLHPLGYLCGCGGSGWNMTDYDSVHKCPYHLITSHHPECDETLRNEEQGLPPPDVTQCCDPPSQPPFPRTSRSLDSSEDLPF